MFLTNSIYQLKAIIHNVKQDFKMSGIKDIYDDYYVFKALDELIPFKNN